MVVDWRVPCLVHWLCLNRCHHGGRVPRQDLRFEPQVDTGVSAPRSICRAGPVAGFQGIGGLASRTKEEDNESRITDRGCPVAGSRLDMSCLDIGRRVLPNGRVHHPWRPVGAHGLPPDMHGPGHLPRWQTGPAEGSGRRERPSGRGCPFVVQPSGRQSPRETETQ